MQKQSGGSLAPTLIFLSFFMVLVALGTMHQMSGIEPTSFGLPGRLDVSVLGENNKLGKDSQVLFNKFPVSAFAIRPTTQELYAGLTDGSIIHINRETGESTLIAETGDKQNLRGGYTCEHRWFQHVCGRPLDMTFDSEGLRLIVADGYKGLLSIDVEEGTVTMLLDSKLKSINSVVVSPHTGLVYFTEASTLYEPKDMWTSLLQGKPNGRVLMYDPNHGTLAVIGKDLYYPAGVTLLDNADGNREAAVLVTELTRSRIKKFTLNEDIAKKPKQNVWNANLPCVPLDILAPAETGSKEVWVTCMPYDSLNVISSFSELPFVRKIIHTLNEWSLRFTLFPRRSVVAHMDAAGKFKSADTDETNVLGTITRMKRVEGNSFVVLSARSQDLHITRV